MKLKSFKLICILIAGLFLFSVAGAQENSSGAPKKLDNPVNASYIKSKMKKSSPRLALTPAIEKNLKSRIKTDPVVANYYAAMKLSAKDIMSRPLLTYNVIGRRLLSTSRAMLQRMTTLAMIYRIDRDPAVLKRIDTELTAICNFQDWHPSHFLDVAEMSLAVAIAVDWTGEFLPKNTVTLAKKSLIEKGIKPSFEKGNFGWVNGGNNWNQVCNGGMIAAAIVIGDQDPELAAKTISRSLEGMPSALRQYAPSGVYPEGATYWNYGTSFSCVTSSILETAFGTDFGIAAYPAFLESANFRLLATAPSGWFFNYADCGDRSESDGDIVLAWFAQKTGNPLYLEKDKFLHTVEGTPRQSRLAGLGLIWLSQFNEKAGTTLPNEWFGDGSNPLAIFRGGKDDPSGYYFGGKGGRGNLSHGNMDAGSFVFELNGVRWVVDPGVQDYNELEQAGFDLWNQTQNSARWSLLTKGNHGHSTITVDDARFNVGGYARITSFKGGQVPEAVVDMTDIFKGHLKSETRKFTKDTNHSITIEDSFELLDSTKSITWAIMTTAEVIPTAGGAILKQDGKQLNLQISDPQNSGVSIIRMDMPDYKLDKKIAGLKKVEIRVPAYAYANGRGTIRVRLTSPE
ncbi:MAG TPA: heparinase II/III family protein [Bacteroidales bacterium]|jgi:hypothetical protein|nr:heparinase II/III family protein [Bacteroidales bacterium]